MQTATPVRQAELFQAQGCDWKKRVGGETHINNWECALKSQQNLWKHNQERLIRCKNWRIQMEIFYGKSCFVSNCLPSGLWVPTFSHS